MTHHVRGRWHDVHFRDIPEPFLMTVVGGSDHWLFLSSTGALTAGRTNAEQAVFSYETEDRLHRAAGQVGPVTAMRIASADTTHAWRPFDVRASDPDRTLSKRTLGDGVRLREVHEPTGLVFSYEWALSDTYGFVRTCRLELPDDAPAIELELVDGLRSILPYGVDSRTQQTASVLVDAYKQAEVVRDDLAVFALTARIVDRPEPAEALRCSVAYQHGLDTHTTFLDDAQFDAFFRHGTLPKAESVRRGRPSGCFFASSFQLKPGQCMEWLTGVDIGWDAARVVALRDDLDASGFTDRVAASVAENRRELLEFVGRADGLQTTSEPVRDDRHASNVMFNCMRGGVIPSDTLDADDVVAFLRARNRDVAERHETSVRELGATFTHDELLAMARGSSDPDLVRLCTEYMPLTFSRRHGDPSRPWNTFNIKVRGEDNTRLFHFEGNWRDVFQNWEALLMSFPEYAEGAWTVFVNATTADGYNPYRITREGIDWERPDPDDPWAHIGYWGDHQIIYSLKLFELCDAHEPGLLQSRLREPLYVYADVPYRIADHDAIVSDPHETITFDREHDNAIERRHERLGGDGNLIHDDKGLVRANLAEKLLVSLLAKLGNYVPDGGIWMNTQRPEWNDANNALVGYGLSVVTLAYTVRHLEFLEDLFTRIEGSCALHAPVADWLRTTHAALADHPDTECTPRERRAILDRLGRAAATYREQVYTRGMGAAAEIAVADIVALLRTARRALSASLARLERTDGAYHGYMLLNLEDDRATIDELPLMLEGQVAAISSGVLGADEVADLVEKLFDSPLYRPDQNTFLLYPVDHVANFLDRGVLDVADVESNRLMAAMAGDDTVNLVRVDAHGTPRFSGGVRHARELAARLNELAERPAYTELVRDHREDVLALWEHAFNHRAYTGRSGSMYGYEGLGSVYWHMVSKLNLAVQEVFERASHNGESDESLRRLGRAYYRLRAGIGDHKTFTEYGAFPTDAYSHTPPGGGARQPGMTGQVKEDILTRRGELGIRVVDGQLGFDPRLLRASEFVSEPTNYYGVGLDGTDYDLELEPGQLAFSVCQVPVRYSLVDGDGVVITVESDEGRFRTDDFLSHEWSREIFSRTGRVKRIDVEVGRDGIFG